jgi:hypothetical protein
MQMSILNECLVSQRTTLHYMISAIGQSVLIQLEYSPMGTSLASQGDVVMGTSATCSGVDVAPVK